MKVVESTSLDSAQEVRGPGDGLEQVQAAADLTQEDPKHVQAADHRDTSNSSNEDDEVAEVDPRSNAVSAKLVLSVGGPLKLNTTTIVSTAEDEDTSESEDEEEVKERTVLETVPEEVGEPSFGVEKLVIAVNGEENEEKLKSLVVTSEEEDKSTMVSIKGGEKKEEQVVVVSPPKLVSKVEIKEQVKVDTPTEKVKKPAAAKESKVKPTAEDKRPPVTPRTKANKPPLKQEINKPSPEVKIKQQQQKHGQGRGRGGGSILQYIFGPCFSCVAKQN